MFTSFRLKFPTPSLLEQPILDLSIEPQFPKTETHLIFFLVSQVKVDHFCYRLNIDEKQTLLISESAEVMKKRKELSEVFEMSLCSLVKLQDIRIHIHNTPCK
jgi:hypothetical protein